MDLDTRAVQDATIDEPQPCAAGKSASEYLRGWKACEEHHVKRLQRQKFLLEVTNQQLREERRKWLEGEDNPALRERIRILENELSQLKEVSRERRIRANKAKTQIKALEEKVEKLEKELAAARERIKELSEPPKKGVKPPTPTELFKDSPAPEGYIVIQFDGGTSSNVPPFGNGYGSHCINSGEIVRLKFDQRMSANVAELKTAMAALKAVQQMTTEPYKVYITGDSQIALKWIESAYKRDHRKVSAKATELFKQTIGELRTMFENNYRISDLKVQWKPRKFSVATFGH